MSRPKKKLLPFPKVPPLVQGAVIAASLVAGACESPAVNEADGGGTPPMAPDAGMIIGPMPPPLMDAGEVLETDAGETSGDAGADGVDAGTDTEDSGTGDLDSGASGFDASVIAPMPPPEPDASILVPPIDAAVIAPMPPPIDASVIAPMPPPMPAPMPPSEE